MIIKSEETYKAYSLIIRKETKFLLHHAHTLVIFHPNNIHHNIKIIDVSVRE